MTRGKKKCEILKTIRCQVAKKNGIPYTHTECTYQGECRGTCPKCEEELRYLTRELEKLKKSGKQVAVAGVAAAVIATTAAGCSTDRIAGPGQTAGVPAVEQTVPSVTMGTPAPQLPIFGSVLNSLLKGERATGVYSFWQDEVRREWKDVLVEEGESCDVFQYEEYRVVVHYDEDGYVDEIELVEEIVLGGEPLPGIPLIGDVITDLQQGTKVYMDGFDRPTVQVEWADWLTESGENYDIFTLDGDQVIITYHEDGWSDSVALYGGETVEDGQ